MTTKRWVGVPYLDALRPGYGWEVEFALISTYSLDMRALVAAMLALGAVDDDRGSGTKVDFANAIEALNNKFRVVCQKGRIIAPRKPQKILALMDQFVREAGFDESKRSWHPKVALVKTVSKDDASVQWRLWIGSRNLTCDTSWDVGLILVGLAGEGETIPGIVNLGFELARRAELKGVESEDVRTELEKVGWIVPEGCSVEDLQFYADPSHRSLPNEPEDLTRLLVISPFVDGGILKKLGSWGTARTHRTLLTTQIEICKLAHQTGKPLDQFDDLLVLESPELGDEEDTNPSEDEEPEARGLHAKIILAEQSNGYSMWVGSANATSRGWNGPNAEVIAKIIPSKALAAGLIEFTRETAATVQVTDIPEPTEEDRNEELLEKARKLISLNWNPRLEKQRSGEWAVVAEQLPFEDLTGIQFSVRPLNGDWVNWVSGVDSVALGMIKDGDESELIFCRVAINGQSISWLQRAPMTPPPNKQRDHSALSRYLDSRTFLQWIRSLLHGTTGGDGGGEWDQPEPNRSQVSNSNRPEWWCPTLEEVLKAWSKNPASIVEVDRKIGFYFDMLKKQPSTVATDEDRQILEAFMTTWQVVKQSLGSGKL